MAFVFGFVDFQGIFTTLVAAVFCVEINHLFELIFQVSIVHL